MAVILDPNAGGAPPKSLASGSWPTAMRTGKWSFTWTASQASSAYAANDEWVWFEFGETDDAVYFNKTAGVARVRIWHSGGVALNSDPFTFNNGSVLTITVDTPNDQLTIAGAATGNGVYNGAWGTFATGDGSLDIGQYHTGIQQIGGTFGNVEDDTAATTGTIAASIPAPVAALTGNVGVNGTIAASIPAPTASLTGTVTAPSAVTGTIAASIPAPTASLAAFVGVNGAIAASIPAPVASLSGSVVVALAAPSAGQWADRAPRGGPHTREVIYRDSAAHPDSGQWVGLTYYVEPIE